MHLTTAPAPSSTPVRVDPFLRLPDVERVTGLKRSTIYALMKGRKFPASVRITPRCVAWRNSQIAQWMEDRIAEADQPQGELGGAA